ncbi:TrkA C-terminal domain-containing protein [bacterium]|nr:TrkA C-terminal domain-containing protein [bacterium]
MFGIYFLLPALVAIFISFMFIRGVAIALMITGMDKRKARFQALSAFSGTGFTTKEAESVVNNPVRRKIITWTIIMGNAGIIAVIVTATSSFVTSKGFQLPVSVVIFGLGIFLIYMIATHTRFSQKWENFIERKLKKSSAFEEAPAEDLLHFLEGYSVVRRKIKNKSPYMNCRLAECNLKEKGLMILGIERGKKWIPIPKAEEAIKKGDKIVVYGPLKSISQVFS